MPHRRARRGPERERPGVRGLWLCLATHRRVQGHKPDKEIREAVAKGEVKAIKPVSQIDVDTAESALHEFCDKMGELMEEEEEDRDINKVGDLLSEICKKHGIT